MKGWVGRFSMDLQVIRMEWIMSGANNCTQLWDHHVIGNTTHELDWQCQSEIVCHLLNSFISYFMLHSSNYAVSQPFHVPTFPSSSSTMQQPSLGTIHHTLASCVSCNWAIHPSNRFTKCQWPVVHSPQ